MHLFLKKMENLSLCVLLFFSCLSFSFLGTLKITLSSPDEAQSKT